MDPAMNPDRTERDHMTIDHDELRRLIRVSYSSTNTQEERTFADVRLAAAVPALLDELARLRAAIEQRAKQCPGCGGSGREPCREYDAASGEMEMTGFRWCVACADLRVALRKDVS